MVTIPFKDTLDFIGQLESRGNYNAYYGNVSNKDSPDLTGMTISEVLDWQKKQISKTGYSAAGKYQILRATLQELVLKHKIDPNAKFDEMTQDQLAQFLLKKRHVDKYSSGQITKDEFMLNLSMEWASLPDPRTGRSFYDKDGVNKHLTTVEDFRASVT